MGLDIKWSKAIDISFTLMAILAQGAFMGHIEYKKQMQLEKEPTPMTQRVNQHRQNAAVENPTKWQMFLAQQAAQKTSGKTRPA